VWKRIYGVAAEKLLGVSMKIKKIFSISITTGQL
jgi:hypothetical protein